MFRHRRIRIIHQRKGKKVKEIKVGIIGFGTVGAGVAENLLNNYNVICTRTSVSVKLHKIADLDITSDRGITVPDNVLTTDANEVINECDIVVELVGGTTIAKKFILQALNNKKHVVTANKALLALHGEELFAAAKANGVDIFFEASVAGGIPIIKALREGLISNKINSIYGIMNGTCNYILTRMENEGVDFDTVLKDAQKLGYAEAEPSLDIDGFDTAHKTAILSALAYGKWFGLEPLFVDGIRNISLFDMGCAAELGYRIKLLAIIKNKDGKVEMRVHPTLVRADGMIGNISDVFNGVMVDGDTVGNTLFYGRGAGRKATASAVVADIVDVAKNIAADSVGRTPAFVEGALFDEVIPMSEIESCYYLRMMVTDRPGVMAQVSQVFADGKINIDSLVQHGDGEGNGVPLIVLTGMTKEKDMLDAIAKLEALDCSLDKVRMLRIENI